MMGMGMAELAATGGAMHGTVIFGVVEMDKAAREDDDESQGRELPHDPSIIPEPRPRVNRAGAAGVLASGWRFC